MSERCADCGAEVEWYPPKDRWGSVIADNDGLVAWRFTCRVERDFSTGMIRAVDYHHVAGEEQQHFRLGT
jgi:hypothetical protein